LAVWRYWKQHSFCFWHQLHMCPFSEFLGRKSLGKHRTRFQYSGWQQSGSNNKCDKRKTWLGELTNYVAPDVSTPVRQSAAAADNSVSQHCLPYFHYRKSFCFEWRPLIENLWKN
jgi:hypothetical protein